MAKKRGGLAGVWDRNKDIIKMLAPMALGAIPGVGVPLAAAAGAAMGGFDRPGKRGMGFDVGGGIRGGLSGTASGMTGSAIQKGISGLLTAKAAPAALGISSPTVTAPAATAIGSPLADISIAPSIANAASNAPIAGMSSAGGAAVPSLPALRGGASMAARTAAPSISPITLAPSLTPSLASSAATTPLAGLGNVSGGGGGNAMRGLLSGAKTAAGTVKDNWKMFSDIGTGLTNMMGVLSNEDIARQKLEQDRLAYERMMEEFRLKQSETQADRESRRRMTQILLPLLQAQFSNVLPPVGG